MYPGVPVLLPLPLLVVPNLNNCRGGDEKSVRRVVGVSPAARATDGRSDRSSSFSTVAAVVVVVGYGDGPRVK